MHGMDSFKVSVHTCSMNETETSVTRNFNGTRRISESTTGVQMTTVRFVAQ